MFLQSHRIENYNLKHEFTLHQFEIFLQITNIDCEYVILFVLTQINLH